MKVVLGLGNDGPEYRFTRHNVGFMVADAIALRCGAAFAARGDLGRLTWTAETEYGGQRVVLAKPRTLMNRSGQAAAALRRKYGAEPRDFVVVFDDADLAFGRVRVRPEPIASGCTRLVWAKASRISGVGLGGDDEAQARSRRTTGICRSVLLW